MHLYGLIIGLSIIIGLRYFENHQHLIPKPKLLFFELGTIFSAIIGARIYHVVDNWIFYSQNLTLIPQTWNGGLGIFGAIFGAVIFIYSYSLFFKFKILKLLNYLTPILPLCQSIGRLGNFSNHEIPTWWLEALPNLFLYLLIKIFPKNPTAKYFIGYGLIRFFTEFTRTDTWTVNNFKIAQIISIIFIVFGLILICHERSQIRQKHS